MCIPFCFFVYSQKRAAKELDKGFSGDAVKALEYFGLPIRPVSDPEVDFASTSPSAHGQDQDAEGEDDAEGEEDAEGEPDEDMDVDAEGETDEGMQVDYHEDEPEFSGAAELDVEDGRVRFVRFSIEHLWRTTYESSDEMTVETLLGYLNAGMFFVCFDPSMRRSALRSKYIKMNVNAVLSFLLLAMPPDKHEDFDIVEVTRAVGSLRDAGRVRFEGNVISQPRGTARLQRY